MDIRSIPITLNYEADKPVGTFTLSDELEAFLLDHHRAVRLSIAISHADEKPKLVQLALVTEVRPVDEQQMANERLDESRKYGMGLSGWSDTIYLGDCIREWTTSMREEQELTRQQMREGLEHSKEVLAFQKSVFEGAHDDT